jgi:hypothetical protein
VTLVVGLAGVVAISAASQAAEPSTHKAKTLTFHVVFSLGVAGQLHLVIRLPGGNLSGQFVAVAGPARGSWR